MNAKMWTNGEIPVGKYGPPVHQTVLRYSREEIVNGKKKVYFFCRCNKDPSHPEFEMEKFDITQRPNKLGCPICRTLRLPDVRTHRTAQYYTGSKVAGCTVVRRVPGNDEKHPVYEFICPYCGNNFVRLMGSMTRWETNHPGENASCGCRSVANKTEKALVRADSMGLQIRDKVYFGYDIKELFPNVTLFDIRVRWTPEKVLKEYYKVKHPGQQIHIDYKDKTTRRCNDGMLVMVPRVRMFPRFPDETGVPVNSYDEYVDRIHENFAIGKVSLIIEGWFVQKDFPDIGVLRYSTMFHVYTKAQATIPWM